MNPSDSPRSPLKSVASAIATVGPVGIHSGRPAAFASGLAAGLYWFLPGDWALRAAVVVAATLLAEWASRSAASSLDPKTVVIDRWAGMWWALLPLRRDPILLVGAFVLFRFFEGRRVSIVEWVAARFGGPRGVYDDVAAGLLAGLTLVLLDQLIPRV